uniref:Uncharacterized protein n=1 Tax=Fagus sylvatica TaxID=28930 RepID=A0A2N9E2M7_FAGSY
MANGSGSEVFDDGDGFSGDTESVATVSRFFGRSSLKEMASQDLENLPMMGKKDAKGSKSAKTAKPVKMEKSPKAQVSIDEVKIMPPPSINVSKSRAIKRAREACEPVDMEVYEDVNNISLLQMCIHDMMKAIGQVLTVGSRLPTIETDLEKSQVKKLKAEAVEKGDLLMASEESCKAFSDQDVTRRYYAGGCEHFRKRVSLAFGNSQDWSLVKMFDDNDKI